MTLESLQQVIDRQFSHPFLAAGVVRTEMREDPKRLSIWIGRRDVEIDEDGNVLGAGTAMLESALPDQPSGGSAMPSGQAMQVIGSSAPARPTLSQSANHILEAVERCHQHMTEIEGVREQELPLPVTAPPVGMGMKLEYAVRRLAALEKRLSGLIDILGEGETV